MEVLDDSDVNSNLIKHWIQEKTEIDKKQKLRAERERELFAKVDSQHQRVKEFLLQEDKEEKEAKRTRKIIHWSLGLLFAAT